VLRALQVKDRNNLTYPFMGVALCGCDGNEQMYYWCWTSGH